MTTHTLQLPRTVHFGPGSVETHLVPALQALRVQSVFLVTGPRLLATGVAAPVQALLNAAGLRCVTFARPGGEPTDQMVEEAMAAWQEAGCEAVIGLGGGSALDLAKCVSVLATNGGGFAAIAGTDRVERPGVPKILIPTTGGSGSEATQAAVVTDTAAGHKRAARSPWLLADVVLVDPALTVTSPPAATIDSGLDVIVTAVEAYLGRTACLFSDLLALEAIRQAVAHLPRAAADGRDLAARTAMSWASLMMGTTVATGGLGAVHALSNPLDTGYHIAHGRAVGLLLAPVLRFNLAGAAAGEKAAGLAAALGGTADADPVAAVQALLQALQVPARLRDYGVPRQALPELARAGWETGRYWLRNNLRPVTPADAEAILAAAW